MTCHHFSSLLYGSGESKQLHGSVQKAPAAFPSIQMLKWQRLTIVPKTETAQSVHALRGHMEIHWERDVTYLEGNGKEAERFASKHLSCQLCAALKMPVAVHWLKRLPCTAVAARLGLLLALGVNASKCCWSRQPQKWGSSEASFFHTRFRSAHLVLSCCFPRESSWLY